MNNKGQLGDWVSSVTVFIGVLGVMSIFVLLSSGVVSIKSINGGSVGYKTSDFRTFESSFLFETVYISGEPMRIISILNGYWDVEFPKLNTQEKNEFKEQLRRFVPVGGCLAIYSSENLKLGLNDEIISSNILPLFLENNEEGIVEFDGDYDLYANKFSKVSVNFVDEDNEIYGYTYSIYKGECLDE